MSPNFVNFWCKYMINALTSLGLLVGQPIFYVFAFLIGCLIGQRRVFSHALVLMLFTMIYNLWLKSIWQVPLPEWLNSQGWAFPSGHMHTAWVFWGTVAIMISNTRVRLFALALVCFNGAALMQAGFHGIKDILGALGFGALSMLIYQGLLAQPLIKKHAYGLGFACALFGFIMIQLLIPTAQVQPYLWQSLGALLGFCSGWAYLQHQPRRLPLIIVSGCAVIWLTTSIAQSSPLLVLQFAGLGLTLSLCANSSKMCQKTDHLTSSS